MKWDYYHNILCSVLNSYQPARIYIDCFSNECINSVVGRWFNLMTFNGVLSISLTVSAEDNRFMIWLAGSRTTDNWFTCHDLS
jgi:hypothetical protein